VTKELLNADGNVLAVKLKPAKGDEQFKVVLNAREKLARHPPSP